MANVFERIRALIERLAPASICDDCIARTLELPARSHANHVTRELAGGLGFERRRGVCSLCSGDKIVVRRRSP